MRIRDPRIFFIICFFRIFFTRDPGWIQFGSGINISDPQHCLFGCNIPSPHSHHVQCGQLPLLSLTSSSLCVAHREPFPRLTVGAGGRGKGLKSDDIKITVDFFLYIPLTTLPHPLQTTNLLQLLDTALSWLSQDF